MKYLVVFTLVGGLVGTAVAAPLGAQSKAGKPVVHGTRTTIYRPIRTVPHPVPIKTVQDNWNVSY